MSPLFTGSPWNSGSSSALDLDLIKRSRSPIDLYPRIGDERWSDRSLSRATWSFLALGVTIRLVRFFLVHPFWSDESFLAANLLQRDYLGLLRPLDYQQVSPVLFLWVELTVVKILGFSEWSLRIFPTLCGIGSLLVFRHLAHRLMRGSPLLFAVAIVSVALNPIRHSGEVKPYASDFLVSTILITLVVEWWRVPDRSKWLWILAAFTPFAMAFSLPSTFVLGAISLSIAFPISRYQSRCLELAYLGFNGMIVVGCLISLFLCSAVSTSETREYMDHYWSSHFPPLSAPAWIPLWLVKALSGHLAAYPAGGANGASALTVIAVATAAWDLTRRSRGLIVAACLAPLGIALLASCFRLYPFGESERLMQFEGPMICLLSGYGLAFWLGKLQHPRSYRRMGLCLSDRFRLDRRRLDRRRSHSTREKRGRHPSSGIRSLVLG